jgi:2-desacetyl-2-hydroxyethyl bacteriochlorophyllide A dehydrogenase
MVVERCGGTATGKVSTPAGMPQRIIFPEQGRVALESFELRAPSADEVSVRADFSLMSIGTETTILQARYAAGTHFAARFSFPQRKTGVQTVATVEAVGTGVTEFRPGDRIFMRMAHTSHWTLPAVQCSPVPADIDPGQACWCGLAKTAFRAAHIAPFSLGGGVLIIGAGPVGQMALRWAHAAGMARIVVADLSELRLAHAAAGGATHCVHGRLEEQRDALLAASGQAGFDVVVDTSGSAPVFAQALGLVGLYGKLVLLGDTGYPAQQCLTSDMMTRGLTVVATHDHHDRDGWTQRRIDALFFELVRAGAFPLDGLMTHRFSPRQCIEAYAVATERREQAVGILFDWAQI